ncbi:ribosome modulation factor [Microbulbifer sp. 2201CG32-9]|uniref:ribosome modulation factor n=1 Tax=unclassified Microbulbifer TaxID=2619833 RepID=UPI00345BD37A
MKRQKRNLPDRAFCKGYLAATENKPVDSCPFFTGDRHQEWINGWREGREDYWNGLGASTKAQKLETYRTVTTETHHPDGWSTI